MSLLAEMAYPEEHYLGSITVEAASPLTPAPVVDVVVFCAVEVVSRRGKQPEGRSLKGKQSRPVKVASGRTSAPSCEA